MKRPHIKITIAGQGPVRSLRTVPVFSNRFTEHQEGETKFQFIVNSDAKKFTVTLLDNTHGLFYQVTEEEPLQFELEGSHYSFELYDEKATRSEFSFKYFVAASLIVHLVLIPSLWAIAAKAKTITPERVEVVEKNEIDKVVEKIKEQEELDRKQNIKREVEQVPTAKEKPKSRIVSKAASQNSPQKEKKGGGKKVRTRRASKKGSAKKAKSMEQSLNFVNSTGKSPVGNFGGNSKGKKGKNSPFGGDKSKKNIMNGTGSRKSDLKDMSNGMGSDSGTISTKSSRTIGTGNGKGKGRGKRNVEGLANLKGVGTGKAGKAISRSGSLSVSGEGEISEKKLGKILRKSQAKFTYCYERALLGDSTLAGKMVIKWRISGKGSVSSVKIQNTQLKNAKLEKCIMGVIKKINFSSCDIKGSFVDVKYPLVFKSSSL